MTEKKWYKSKTMWLNIAVGLVAVGNEMTPILDVLDPEVRDQVRVFLVMASTIGNTILRTVTSQGITR